ncbi:MAG: hypothetical protein LBP23_07320 [Treponema sp.]|jgi:hypothetical protein|nr:hypothetical protein [Treponema sp.]
MAETLDGTNQNQGGNGNQADNGNQSTGNADSLANIMTGAQGKEPGPKPATRDTGEGNGTDAAKAAAWTNQLPEELKGNPELLTRLAKFQKLGDMAASYLELEKRLGKAAIIPDRNAPADERAAFWKRLGKPETKEGYTIAKQENGDVFLEAAHAANLTDEQATAVFEHIKKLGETQIGAIREKQAQQFAETEAALKSEYGDRYPEKIELLKRGLKIAGDDVGTLLNGAGIAGHPGIVRAFITLGELTAESGSPRSRGGGPAGPRSIKEGAKFSFKQT